MTNKTKKVLSVSFKAAILLLAFSSIYKTLSNNTNLHNFVALTQNLSAQKVNVYIVAIFLLMFLNWYLESLKWKFLVYRIEPITTWKAIESVFCGLTCAVLTPNRIGEYGGRVLFLKPRKRIFGIIAMAVGAVGQMVVTNILGSLALLWFIGRFIPLNIALHYAIAFLTFVFCAFFLLFYFNIRWMNNLLHHIKIFKPFHKFFLVLARYSQWELFKIFFYCIARYIVFSSQYYLIIHLLIPDMAVLPMAGMIFILFFIQSALPSLDLLDVGVRSMTATYFFGFITTQEVAIIASIACIWLVNLIIPAILGSVFVLKLNFFGTRSN